MNGAQDLGGQHGFGPVHPEADEPLFHAGWEPRALAVTVLMGAVGGWNIDQSRAARESLPPLQYLGSTYYEIWIAGLEMLMLERGIVAADELAAGRPLHSSAALRAAPNAKEVGPTLARGSPTERPVPAPARFVVGQAVRTIVSNPLTHTRLPRYLRGRPGTVTRIHGVHVFADSNAGGNENPQWLYSVRFDATELWGHDTTASTVNADCWEPYLEPA